MADYITVVRFPNGNTPEGFVVGAFFFYYEDDLDDNTIGGAMQRYLVYGEPTEIHSHYQPASSLSGANLVDRVRNAYNKHDEGEE